MPVIDADTHVDEREETWQYMEGDDAKYRPMTIVATESEVPRPGLPSRGRWWLYEGRMNARLVRVDSQTGGTTVETRELYDVPARLRHMDQMGVDIQVIFPTFFIRHLQNDPAADVALTSSYNRWIAEKCSQSEGRLRWIAAVPLSDIGKAVEELRWAKDHGACGLFKRGFDLGKQASDPYFFPLYAEAAALDMPVCIHTGVGGEELNRIVPVGLLSAYPAMSAFDMLVRSKVPDTFPKLRFGFIEAGASWVPYGLSRFAATQREGQRRSSNRLELKDDLFRTYRLYVALDAVDDIEYLLKFGTEDNLMIGTDYGHIDVSANITALDQVRGWAEEGKISHIVARKILEDNPKAFYGL